MNLPDWFQSEEQYEAWLDELVQHEADELLEEFEEEDIHKDQIDVFVSESGQLAHPDSEWAKLYHDVKEHSLRASEKDHLQFNQYEWFTRPYSCMARLVRHWVIMDVADRVQIEVEKRGVST